MYYPIVDVIVGYICSFDIGYVIIYQTAALNLDETRNVSHEV